MRWRSAAVVAVAAMLQACALMGPSTPPVVGGRQEGIASWYGPGFHGKRTANGEVFDQYQLTAAHQTLPLGSRVLVTSLVNGRAVEVRINDRGPFVGGRVVDLSYAAARVLGMVGPGTMPVRVELLDAPVQVASRRPVDPRPRRTAPAAPVVAPAPPVSTPPPPGRFTVLVATLRDGARAEHLRGRIALKFDDAQVHPLDVGAERVYRVTVGPYPSREVAHARATLVNRYGYPAVVAEASAP
jgi:rare lipoprotein A